MQQAHYVPAWPVTHTDCTESAIRMSRRPELVMWHSLGDDVAGVDQGLSIRRDMMKFRQCHVCHLADLPGLAPGRMPVKRLHEALGVGRSLGRQNLISDR